MLIDDGIEPILPYKSFFRKHEYVYDEYYDCYICPNEKLLKYATTNRDGYREYKSCASDCMNCPLNNAQTAKTMLKLLRVMFGRTILISAKISDTHSEASISMLNAKKR